MAAKIDRTNESLSPKPPLYVDRWRLGGSPQPVVAKSVHMDGFVFLVDADVVEESTSRYLDVGKDDGVKYKVPGSGGGRTIVLLTFNSIKRYAAKNPPYSSTGFGEELEMAVFVPAVRNGHLQPEIFTPYIVVDNPDAMWRGREIYGWPKEFGRLRFATKDDPDHFTVEVFGVEKFEPDAKLDFRKLVEMKKTASGAPFAPWSTYDDAARDLNAALAQRLAMDGMKMPPPFGGDTVWAPRGPLVFLKQFHDAEDGARPCYQALIGAEMLVPKFRCGVRLGHSWELSLATLRTHPIACDLDIKNGDSPILSYWMDFDFEVTVGQEIWRAAPPRFTS